MIAIPLLFILQGLFELPDAIDTIVRQDSSPSDLKYYLGEIGTIFDFMAHWIFSCQYLKTSLIFPRVFRQADLELITTTGGGSDVSKASFDNMCTMKMDDKLQEHGFFE